MEAIAFYTGYEDLADTDYISWNRDKKKLGLSNKMFSIIVGINVLILLLRN